MLAALAFGLVVPWALPGCGGGDGGPELVKPEVAPAVSSKDSMNAFIQSSHVSKPKGRTRVYR